jgi:hypothetical protein
MTTSWIDHYAGEGGDMFALIMREQACDFGEAIRRACEFCGMRDAAGEWNRTLVQLGRVSAAEAFQSLFGQRPPNERY